MRSLPAACMMLALGPAADIAAADQAPTRATRVEVVGVALAPRPPGQNVPIVVVSTRVARPIDEAPVPVDVMTRGAIEETMSMAPGDIVSLLDRMPTLRAQTTSPELGLTMFRIRGLRGQYTRLFSDGVPLDFDRSGGLALLQLSPMDLAQVEVLTDGAAAIFGMNTLSGAVNLLSRRPAMEPRREFLFSQSASGGTDGALWFSTPPTRNWSTTTLFGGYWQDERDVDDDSWSDIPGHARGTARTRVLYDNRRGKSASGTAGVTFEKREGGSAFAHQVLETKEADGALFGQMPLGQYTLAGAATLFVQSRARDFVDRREHERRQSATIEITLSRSTARHTWLAGIASEWFANRTPTAPLPSAYTYTGPSIFAHDEMRVASWLTATGSVRLDYHLDNGAALSPRGSALVHHGPWVARVSAGRSYSDPEALTEEIEGAGLARLTIGDPLKRERSDSVSGDLTYTTPTSVVRVGVFHTTVNNPALVDRATYTLRTESDPVVTHGVEVLGTARRAAFAVTGTYAYLRARERGDVEVALTPRHHASFIASWTSTRGGRLGAQAIFTGVQRLDANPYRTTSEPYAVVNLMGEYPFGRWHLFANAENVTDVRQTRWDPIARPVPDFAGQWTVDAWAPVRGRVINVGFKVSF
jgi:outer membrane receptor for ferrienterochelin and colicins